MSSRMNELQILREENARLRMKTHELEAELAQDFLHAVSPGGEFDLLSQNYSNAQLSAILETMDSAVVIITADSGRFIYVNRRAHELYGTNYVGVKLTDHADQIQALRPDGTPYAVEELPASRSIRNGEVVRNDEIIILRPNGARLTVLANSAPLYDAEGKIVAAVADFRDISERKLAEDARNAALDAAKARMRELQAVVESVPDGLAVYGRDRQLVFMNGKGQALTRLFMTLPDSAAGTVAVNAFDDAGLQVLQEDEVVNRIFTRGEIIQEEIFSTAPDREPVTWIAMSGAPIKDEGGTIIGAVVLSRDISERRKIERTVAFQSHLLECVQDAIYATDNRYCITYWNKPAEELLGWKSEEALGRNVRELLNPTIPYQDLSATIDVLMKCDVVASEPIYRHKNGMAVDVENLSRLIRDKDGNICETITTFRDIHKRKQAETALRESERKYRELVKYAPTAIFEYDNINQHFITVNDCMVEMSGYSREELLSMDPWILLDDSTTQAASERIRRREIGNTFEPKVEHTWITKDGRRIHIELYTFHQYQNGRPIIITGIAHNITERKLMELALQRQTEELKAADRNKSQFISVLSHELRNPLAAIIASLDLIDHIKIHEDQKLRAMGVIRRQSSQLAHLVDDLLDLTRINENKIRLKKEPINLPALVEKIINNVESAYKLKGVSLSLCRSNEIIELNADPVRLTQVMENLLGNALKFTRDGDHVQVWLIKDKHNQEVIIKVCDTGAGLAPEVLSHLFVPFTQGEQTLARTEGGLGLGLSIVKGMIELHGGRVAAESEGIGKGATFTIYLPIQ